MLQHPIDLCRLAGDDERLVLLFTVLTVNCLGNSVVNVRILRRSFCRAGMVRPPLISFAPLLLEGQVFKVISSAENQTEEEVSIQFPERRMIPQIVVLLIIPTGQVLLNDIRLQVTFGVLLPFFWNSTIPSIIRYITRYFHRQIYMYLPIHTETSIYSFSIFLFFERAAR